MTEKSPRSVMDTQEIDAEIAELKQDLSRNAGKVAGVRRQRRIRRMVAAMAGGILGGTPAFVVHAEAGVFATLVGAFVGYSAIQLYFLMIPAQFAIGSVVRRHRRAQEEVGRLLDERRRSRGVRPIDSRSNGTRNPA